VEGCGIPLRACSCQSSEAFSPFLHGRPRFGSTGDLCPTRCSVFLCRERAVTHASPGARITRMHHFPTGDIRGDCVSGVPDRTADFDVRQIRAPGASPGRECALPEPEHGSNFFRGQQLCVIRQVWILLVSEIWALMPLYNRDMRK